LGFVLQIFFGERQRPEFKQLVTRGWHASSNVKLDVLAKRSQLFWKSRTGHIFLYDF
jgi:hypothetical protein